MSVSEPTSDREGASPPPGWQDHAVGVALAAGFVVILLMTTGMGFTRDEGYYFHAAYDYLGWFKELAANLSQGGLGESFGQASIDKHFNYNREHPVLPKALFALSYWLFHEGLGWMSASTAMRFPGMLFSGALIYLVYIMCVEAFGRWEALFAAVATAAMPRPFFHAHLACFDAPVSTMWFLVMMGYWKGLRSSRWGWATGVFLGLALSIKHNIFFLPPLLVAHWLVVRGHMTALFKQEDHWRLRLPPVPVSFLSMAILGPLVWLALWPTFWFDTYNRIAAYFAFHLKHEHYFQYYFGQNLYEPPFPVEFPFVMSLLTMPPVTVLACLVGGAALMLRWSRARQGVAWLEPLRERARAAFGDSAERVDPRGTGWWLALGAVVPFLVIAQPSTPIFGGIKHWMPAMPFMAILAGVGAVAAVRALVVRLPASWPKWSRPAALALSLGLLLTPAVTATVHNHPHGTAFYNVLIGGTRGAADARMMRQFWGFSSRNALPFLNESVGQGRPVFFQNTNTDSWRMYRQDRSLRMDVRYGRMPTSDYGLIHHQMAARSLELDIWKTYKTRNPAFVGSYDGVPVISVYPNRKRVKAPKAPSPPSP